MTTSEKSSRDSGETDRRAHRYSRSLGARGARRSLAAQHAAQRSKIEVIADALTKAAASAQFLVFHVVWFGAWILLNVGLFGIKPFDPFPFGLLTLVVSLEAIFLSIFVLMAQSRESAVEELREEVSLQVVLRMEEEVTKTLQLVAGLYSRLGYSIGSDEDLTEMLGPLDADKIEKDLIRYMNEDPQYLTNFNIRVFDSKGNEVPPETINWQSLDALNYTFRQDPGGENSMGHCKVDFYNPYDCYLHDTPAKALFGQNSRFHSSGCVRVEGIDQVAAWLLRDNGGWDLAAVDAMFATNENVNVPLTFQMPLHTTYVTAWANRDGVVSFRDDIYEYDAQGKVTFES